MKILVLMALCISVRLYGVDTAFQPPIPSNTPQVEKVEEEPIDQIYPIGTHVTFKMKLNEEKDFHEVEGEVVSHVLTLYEIKDGKTLLIHTAESDENFTAATPWKLIDSKELIQQPDGGVELFRRYKQFFNDRNGYEYKSSDNYFIAYPYIVSLYEDEIQVYVGFLFIKPDDTGIKKYEPSKLTNPFQKK
ncbi:MAG: hypothetical protein LBD29_00595 [Treponema sp.]|nr:hypothetical protein [Treponema sp.]